MALAFLPGGPLAPAAPEHGGPRPLARAGNLRAGQPLAQQQLPGNDAGAPALLLLAAGAASGVLAGLREGRSGRRSQRALIARRAGEFSDNYVPVFVRQGEGEEDLEIDVRLSDSVKVLKAMVAVELDIPEKAQELSFNGEKITEDVPLGKLGMVEGSIVQLEVLEIQETEIDELEKDALSFKIFITCDAASPGKIRQVPMSVLPTDTIMDLKVKAFYEMRKFTESFNYANPEPEEEYGLFIPTGEPTKDARGNLRELERDEYLKDRMTIKELGIRPGQQILFADMMWAPGVKRSDRAMP